jgi:hypothetical protein
LSELSEKPLVEMDRTDVVNQVRKWKWYTCVCVCARKCCGASWETITRAQATKYSHLCVLTWRLTQTRVVDRFMKNILKYVEDGMDDV